MTDLGYYSRTTVPGYFGSGPQQSPRGARPATTSSDGGGLAAFGFWSSIGASVMSAVGTFYSAKSQKSQLESQALSSEFEQSMANLEARAAEFDATQILRAARREAGRVSMAAGQEKSRQKVSAAARGVDVNTGSAVDVRVSTEMASQADRNAINENAVAGAAAQGRRATDARNRASIAGVNASNARATSRTINPYMAHFSSVLGSVGTLSNAWVANRRWSRYGGR